MKEYTTVIIFMKKFYPTISIGVIVYNEEKRIKNVLDSIYSQDYPKSKLDVIVVDDNSQDNTVSIAKKYPVRILISGKKDAEISGLMAFQAAKGDFITFLAGDMQFASRSFLKKMIKPLVENKEIPQAATRYIQHKDESLISKYLSLDPLQLDPVYRFFASSIESTIVEKKKGYFITEYKRDRIPPQNAGMFRVSIMKKVYKNKNKWMDLDQFHYLLDMGYSKFAYVPTAGFNHFFASSFSDLLRKRKRNLTRVYLPNISTKRYTWFSLKTIFDWIKIGYWIILANLFIPLFIMSVFKSLRDKTALHLLDAPVALVLTDVLLFNMIKEKEGRKLVLNGIYKIFGFK